jgi:potassium/hydrogen antiporter
VIGGSGFLAVYLVGLAVGSTPSRHRRQLVAFHEGLAFLAQVAMFVVLGLLVFPHRLGSVALSGLALAALLALLIRPVAVWVTTALSRFSTHERALLGWAGLRGAVPIVLGTIVLSSRINSGETIFNAVFSLWSSRRLSKARRRSGLPSGFGLCRSRRGQWRHRSRSAR